MRMHYRGRVIALADPAEVSRDEALLITCPADRKLCKSGTDMLFNGYRVAHCVASARRFALSDIPEHTLHHGEATLDTHADPRAPEMQ